MDTYLITKDKTCCCGCGACAIVCPTSSISFLEDELGFSYPKINESTCVHCGRCESVCQYHNCLKHSTAIETYVAKAKDIAIIQNSSSGGVFFEIGKSVLYQKGVVYGAAFDSFLRVSHQRVAEVGKLTALQKSKYVQSDIKDVFVQVRQDLANGLVVLFSGTPCQVASLKNYLGKEYKRLICVDVACHGAPGQTDFEHFKKYLQNKYHGNLTKLDFRSKKRGWAHMCSFDIEDESGKKHSYFMKPYRLPYYFFFLHGFNFRDSCYACPYASLNRVSDLTLADCWGVEQLGIHFDSRQGLSLVLANTLNGQQLFHDVSEQFEWAPISSDFPAKSNQPFKAPCKKPDNREELLKDIMINGYRIEKKYLSNGTLLKEMIKGTIPQGMKSKVRLFLAKNRNEEKRVKK